MMSSSMMGSRLFVIVRDGICYHGYHGHGYCGHTCNGHPADACGGSHACSTGPDACSSTSGPGASASSYACGPFSGQ